MKKDVACLPELTQETALKAPEMQAPVSANAELGRLASRGRLSVAARLSRGAAGGVLLYLAGLGLGLAAGDGSSSQAAVQAGFCSPSGQSAAHTPSPEEAPLFQLNTAQAEGSSPSSSTARVVWSFDSQEKTPAPTFTAR